MIFAMGDLHLSFGVDKPKPMNIFKGWENHIERLAANWNKIVSDKDTVVIPGDISWAIKLENAKDDFEFINRTLNGNKIILKGNHDYWWSTTAKMKKFLSENGFDKITILNNFAVPCEDIVICGTRGWINDNCEPFDVKILDREARRLELSIKNGLEIMKSSSAKEMVAFIHYPPIFNNEENFSITEVLRKYGIKRCYYGHVHGPAKYKAFTGVKDNVQYFITSADIVGFSPVLI